ncbi:ankyrin repeat and sterile alpha motif domain-containing protein 1B-like [Forsythia ovata]|uniref:Ankyrin repeat and sterile alpha motif domain-containing protein 1B-like n=1 Tax=Forsythia ovata TaxID=205694 RepID=A0ABD1U9P3_9LAMI
MVNQVAQLLQECETKKGHNPLIRADYGGWLLYTATSAGQVIFVKQLLDKDPFLYTARGGNVEILRKLLKDESNFLAYRDAQESTVLHTASGRGQVEFVVGLGDKVLPTDIEEGMQVR